MNENFRGLESLDPVQVKLPSRPYAKLAEHAPPTMGNLAAEIDAAEAEFDRQSMPQKYLERLENSESFNPDAKYFDFFNLSDAEIDELKEDVKKADGIVRIFVHPYYSLNDIKPANHAKMQDRIDAILQNILSKGKAHRPPVIFMEGYSSIEDLYQFIRGFNADDVYIAPTYDDTSQPYPSDDSTKEVDHVFNCQNWQNLIERLQTIGVRKILIGGQYLMIPQSPSQHPESSRYGRCLGQAINNLRTKFDVKLSNASNISRIKFHKAIQHDNKLENDNFNVDI